MHPDHIGESESVDCVNVNWDDTDTKSGQTWEQLGSLPLIGPGGYAGSSWESVDHINECVESAPWTLRTRLTESNTFGLADILAAIGDALTQGNASGATGGKLFLYGEAAKIAAKTLRELFADLDNLGAVPLKWEAGEGDPDQVVPKGPDEARHFKAGGQKTVTRVSPDCKPTTTTTPTTGTTTTPPIPPPGTGTETTPTETETTPTETETTPTDTTGTTTTGTTMAPPLASAAQARPCGSDARHILCENAASARRSWRKLDLAARRIARLRARRPGRGAWTSKGPGAA